MLRKKQKGIVRHMLLKAKQKTDKMLELYLAPAIKLQKLLLQSI